MFWTIEQMFSPSRVFDDLSLPTMAYQVGLDLNENLLATKNRSQRADYLFSIP